MLSMDQCVRTMAPSREVADKLIGAIRKGDRDMIILKLMGIPQPAKMTAEPLI